MDIKKAFQTYFISAFKRYFDFKGRTSRKAYWMFVLISMIIGWAIIALDNILGTEDLELITLWGIHYGMFYNFYSLVLVIPGLSIAVRRLHDVGIEGKKMWMILIPVYGIIWLFFQLIREGDPGENDFGPVPDDEMEPAGHPYTPNKKDNAESFDVVSLRKEAEERIKKSAESAEKKPKNRKKKFTLRDRSAVDFTYHSKEKRKT
jgi:uncharacterized membrane protein YhaH (DUF805 family)